jgi:hypothetical protein
VFLGPAQVVGDSATASALRGGLIGLLVLFAAVALLVGRRYPPGLFELVLGMDRWVARVAGYALLLTDRYPPFRLDQGDTEPDGPVPPPSAPHGSVPPGGRVGSATTGGLLVLIGLTLSSLGCVGLVGDTADRDPPA